MAAYNDAAVPEADILGDLEKDLRGEGEDFLGKQKTRRRKDRIGTTVNEKTDSRSQCCYLRCFSKSCLSNFKTIRSTASVFLFDRFGLSLPCRYSWLLLPLSARRAFDKWERTTLSLKAWSSINVYNRGKHLREVCGTALSFKPSFDWSAFVTALRREKLAQKRNFNSSQRQHVTKSSGHGKRCNCYIKPRCDQFSWAQERRRCSHRPSDQ